MPMDSRVKFHDSETRHDEMHSTIDEWLNDPSPEDLLGREHNGATWT